MPLWYFSIFHRATNMLALIPTSVFVEHSTLFSGQSIWELLLTMHLILRYAIFPSQAWAFLQREYRWALFLFDEFVPWLFNYSTCLFLFIFKIFWLPTKVRLLFCERFLQIFEVWLHLRWVYARLDQSYAWDLLVGDCSWFRSSWEPPSNCLFHRF